MKKFLFFIVFTLTFSSCSAKEKITYSDFLEDLISQKNNYKADYLKANKLEKKAIIIEARQFLTNKIATELFPYWYGTPWDFHGMTRTPQKGKIACGYFVTNTLTDAGFNIPRIKWAQSASEVFIKKLAHENIKRFSNKPISKIEQHLLQQGDGLYLAGLDSHTGFLFVDGKTIRFIHADYFEPKIGVVSEEIDSESPINYSKYRVIGKLMSDQMMTAWIKDEKLR